MSDHHLCKELIIEIFTRLPAKSLLRFRSLSKSWYYCIGSPAFIRMHTLRSPQKLLFRHQLHYEAYGVEYFYSLHSDDFCTLHSEDQLPLCPTNGYNGITPIQFPCRRIFRIIGSCNGLICLSEYPEKIIVWNPSIRRQVALPNCPRKSGLAWTGLGFGFDPITDDYKVVWISNAQENSFLYSLKTATWCVISFPTHLISNVLMGGCFVNGALHWVVVSHDMNSHFILTFDLSTYAFGMIPLPKPLWRVTRLTTLQGSLAVIYGDYREDESWIWVRRDDYWYVVFKSKENKFKGGVVKEALQLTTNGDLLLSGGGMGQVHVYYYITNKGGQSRLVDFHAASFITDFVQCVESLHLLHSNMETACKPNQRSDSGGKRTSKIRYLNDLFYYFKFPFKLLFNMRR